MRQINAALLSPPAFAGPAAKAVLEACGIPVTAAGIAGASTAATIVATRAMDRPAALRFLSPQITHKNEVVGVALDMADEADLLVTVAECWAVCG